MTPSRVYFPAVLFLLATAGCGPAAPAAPTYVPSNVPKGFAWDTRSEVVLSGKTSIDLNAEPPVLQATRGQYTAQRVTQGDGKTPLVVFFMKDLTVTPDAEVTVYGEQPVAFVAAGRVSISGTVDVGAGMDGRSTRAGGQPAAMGEEVAGLGAGAGCGPVPGMKVGAGGAGFCGRGGAGAAGGTNGGAPYGTPALVPLLGGSSGGSAFTGAYGGAGGDALQLFAGEGLEVTATGRLLANGGGGTQYGGGGSGGALLLESPVISIASAQALSVNGGGGGANYFAGPLTDNSGGNGSAAGPGAGGNPVPDAVAMDARNAGGAGGGGFGSGAASVDGAAGVYLGPPQSTGFKDYGGGGGGGAGRVRFNTTPDGGVTLPGALGDCATLGALATD